MRDECYEILIEEMGEPTHITAVPEKTIQQYQGKLPNLLLQYWKDEGWCGFANGLFWTVNPEKYKALVDDWLKGSIYENVDNYHAIGRTAFGKLYVWGEKNQRKLTISCPANALIGIDKELRSPNDFPDLSLETFISGYRDDHDLVDNDDNLLFDEAQKKLGSLSENEVYGFEPALILGGEMKVENLKKLDLFAHLSILRELGGPPSAPYANIDVNNLE